MIEIKSQLGAVCTETRH